MGSFRDAKCHRKEKLEVMGPTSGSKKKQSKGAAVFPEVKRMIKRLKRTSAKRTVSVVYPKPALV